MDQVQDLLGLPVQLLSVLAAGYLSYRLAYAGRDASHKSVDVVFIVFVFAFVAQLTAGLAGGFLWPTDLGLYATQVAASLTGLAVALAVAAGWRRWGVSGVFRFLRNVGVSHSDRHTSAWQSVIYKPGITFSTLIIRKSDGSMLMSERLADFNDLPFGSCILGVDGSVALYVTHKWPAGADDWEARDPSNHCDWGAQVTIVPASAISEIELRAS